MKKELILIVDDDPAIRFAFNKTFDQPEYRMISAVSGQQALELIAKEQPALVFLDIAMPSMSGLEVLDEIHAKWADIQVVIITGEGSMQAAIRAMQSGAYDYLTKPLDIDQIRLTAKRALELARMRRKLTELEQRLENQTSGATELIGNTAAMQEIYKKIGIISTTPQTTNILILGETGTGKELVARVIHESGSGKDYPFQAINCTVLPETLLESELFGHEKGAFTGADRQKPGKLEVAANGTLFLDEIGDMPEHLQKKLLRVIQERSFERLGGTKLLPLKARIIAATHQDLTAGIRERRFREDLYYRLNVIEIMLPPLRERMDDLDVLIHYFIAKYNRRMNKSIGGAAVNILEKLRQYNFPGNVRELENLIERAVALERGNVLSADFFPPQILDSPLLREPDVARTDDDFQISKQKLIEAFEKKFITRKLTQTRGNVSEAARMSGIERQSFQRLMKKYNIVSEDFRR